MSLTELDLLLLSCWTHGTLWWVNTREVKSIPVVHYRCLLKDFYDVEMSIIYCYTMNILKVRVKLFAIIPIYGTWDQSFSNQSNELSSSWTFEHKHRFPFHFSSSVVSVEVHLQKLCSPEAILLSWAAGPSLSTFFTCRNSSVRSPPMMVKPNPWGLFFSAVWYNSPFSWLGSAVKPDVPPLPMCNVYLWVNVCVWKKGWEDGVDREPEWLTSYIKHNWNHLTERDIKRNNGDL